MVLLYIGFSEQSMAICEIGVSFPDDTFGKESRFGIPFTVCIGVTVLLYSNTLILIIIVFVKRYTTVW